MRKVTFVFVIVIVSLLYAKDAGGQLLSNIGWVIGAHRWQRVSNRQLPVAVAPENLFEQALLWDPRLVGAKRGLGFVHWHGGEDAQALNLWREAGWEADDYVQFAQISHEMSESFRWYWLAELIEPTYPELWLHVGQICQRDPLADNICTRFLVFNQFNWLVDPEFAFDQASWRFNRREGAEYTITTCPGALDKKCARVEIYEVTSPHGTGWLQCLTLKPGQRYRFSAWIKVETEGEWIALYYQGGRDGDPHGIKLSEYHEGAQDWTFFDQEFVAPEFDDHRACFHPLRLLDVGSAWFHSAALRLVE